MQPTEMVSIKQAQALVGVSRRTIYNWLKAGKLRYRRTASGSIRIDQASLWAGEESRAVPEPVAPPAAVAVPVVRAQAQERAERVARQVKPRGGDFADADIERMFETAKSDIRKRRLEASA